jgi:hypothetical protein
MDSLTPWDCKKQVHSAKPTDSVMATDCSQSSVGLRTSANPGIVEDPGLESPDHSLVPQWEVLEVLEVVNLEAD